METKHTTGFTLQIHNHTENPHNLNRDTIKGETSWTIDGHVTQL